ncbi:MAG: hypothetical protein JNM93_05535 [Bacteriovoracaceae bacterium]|nr:hypothetical protein [Bacteriovoracaceae bacterium]
MKYIITLSLILVSLAAFATPVIDYGEFVQRSDEEQMQILDAIHLFMINQESNTRTLPEMKKAITGKKYALQIDTGKWLKTLLLPKPAYAQATAPHLDFDKIDGSRRCIYAGWISVMMKAQIRDKQYSVCYHPGHFQNKAQFDSIYRDDPAKKEELWKAYEKINKHYLETVEYYKIPTDVKNIEEIACNPVLFGVPDSKKAISGDIKSRNSSLQCWLNMYAQEDKTAALDKILQQVKTQPQFASYFAKILESSYNMCVCHGKNEEQKNVIAEKYVKDMYFHRTCLSLMRQTQAVLSQTTNIPACEITLTDGQKTNLDTFTTELAKNFDFDFQSKLDLLKEKYNTGKSDKDKISTMEDIDKFLIENKDTWQNQSLAVEKLFKEHFKSNNPKLCPLKFETPVEQTPTPVGTTIPPEEKPVEKKEAKKECVIVFEQENQVDGDATSPVVVTPKIQIDGFEQPAVEYKVEISGTFADEKINSLGSFPIKPGENMLVTANNINVPEITCSKDFVLEKKEKEADSCEIAIDFVEDKELKVSKKVSAKVKKGEEEIKEGDVTWAVETKTTAEQKTTNPDQETYFKPLESATGFETTFPLKAEAYTVRGSFADKDKTLVCDSNTLEIPKKEADKTPAAGNGSPLQGPMPPQMIGPMPGIMRGRN